MALWESRSAMTQSGKIRAWIEQYNGGEVSAKFIGVMTLPDGQDIVADREPAVTTWPSVDCARRWVESEAAAVGLPVEWVEYGSGAFG